jgi:hypothetical protein
MSRLPYFYTIGSQMAAKLSAFRAGRALSGYEFSIIVIIIIVVVRFFQLT